MEPALAHYLETASAAADHRDPPSIADLANAIECLLRDEIQRATWFEHCCDPLYAHLKADAWRLDALSRQHRVDPRHLRGVMTAALRRVDDWRRRAEAHDAAVEAEHRALLAEEGR